jgi:hypothetical protein
MVVVRNARKSGVETEFGLRLTAIFYFSAIWKLYGIGLPDPVREALL